VKHACGRNILRHLPLRKLSVSYDFMRVRALFFIAAAGFAFGAEGHFGFLF
jgi:hypothetical protein